MIRYRFCSNMRILFVGINPHFGSFRRGVPFSNNKMFWYLLSRSGVINEREEELRDDGKLKQIYLQKFTQVYNYGFINIIDRPTRVVTELNKGEEAAGRRRIVSVIRKYHPRIVCFIGRVTYAKFTGSKNFNFGWQQDILTSRVYVMHFPIRGEAIVRIRELQELLGPCIPRTGV